MLDLDADNKAARNKVAICLQEIKAQKNRDKKIFANMFDKVPELSLIDIGDFGAENVVTAMAALPWLPWATRQLAIVHGQT